MKKLTRSVAALGALGVLTFVGVSPVQADDNNTMQAQYTTLAGALIQAHASESGQTLSGYLSSQQIMLFPTSTQTPASGLATATVGTPTLSSTLGQGSALNAVTLEDLNKQLSQAGAGFTSTDFQNLSTLADAVTAKSATPDAAVTAAGAKWAAQLATLRVPGLSKTVSMPTTPGIPKGALPFGLLMDKSITNLITNNPDLFTTAKSKGLGSAKLTAAWSAAMSTAWTQSSKSLTSVLPDPCTGGMLAVMATGKSSSATGACSTSCATGGLYLHNQAMNLFSPTMNTIDPNPTSQVWNSSTAAGMQDWIKGLLVQQNTQLTPNALSQAISGSGTPCGQASTATTKTLQGTLPGVFKNLVP